MTATEGGAPTVNEEGARALGSSYVVYERVGRGATGVVHRALDRRSGDVVAVKFLRSDLASDAHVVERFLRERAILTRLGDPHTVGLRDLVVEGETVALVTDFVDGGDLRALLNRDGALPVDAAVDVAAQVLEGLAAAHERGVVHCDLKPENVLVTHVDGHLVARVTDFGIATLLRAAPDGTSGGLVGSPDYMAPEVVEGRELTPAADLYGTGILLYELLCGRTPFAGGPAVAVLRRHVEEPPLRLPDVPGGVWNQIVTLLAKDPRRRPPSARVAASRLRASLSGAPPALDENVSEVVERDAGESPTFVPHTPPRGATPRDAGAHRDRYERARSHRGRWVAAGVVAALALAGAAVALARAVSHDRARAAADHVRLTTTPVLQTFNGSDVVVTRTWDLSGRGGDRVDVTLRVRNAGTKPVVSIDELGLEQTKTRPITTLAVDLAPGESTTVSYRRTVPGTGLDVRRIEEWERTLDVFTSARLADAQARPSVLALDRGMHSYLNVTGVTTAGDVAAPELLDGLEWSSSDTRVARVRPGTRSDWRPVIEARSPGAAVLTARLGTRTLRVDVVVASTRARAASTRLPCEPGIGSPPELVDVPDGTAFTSGNGRITIVAGGARVASGEASAFGDTLPVQQVDADWLAMLPAVPRDGTLLDEDGRSLWLVVDGQRVAVTTADLAALHIDANTAVTVPANTIGVPVLGSVAPAAGALVRPVASATTYLWDGRGWTPTLRACSASTVPTVPGAVPPSAPSAG